MNCIIELLNRNAGLITALATIVIAVFSWLTWRAYHSIYKASLDRDKELNTLYLNLVSAIMASGKTTGEPIIGAKAFKDQREQLLELFKPENMTDSSQGHKGNPFSWFNLAD